MTALERRIDLDPQKLCLNADTIDTTAFLQQLEEQKPLHAAFAPGDLELGADLFTALYRLKPTLKEQPPAPIRAQVLAEAMQTSAYHKLHSSTALDDMLSAAGTLALRRYLKQETKLQCAIDKEIEAQSIKQQLEMLSELQQDQENLSLLQTRLEQAQEAARQALQEVPNLRQALSKTFKQANEQIESAQRLAADWGHEPGVLEELLFNEQLEKLLNNKLKRILELAGRMREVIAAERAKRPLPAPDEVDLELGNDIANLIPSELTMLADADLEELFYKRYTDRALLQFKRTEKPKLGKGPFVVCVDESGSMQGFKEQWAKALALALMMQAHKEKRQFGAVAFGSNTEYRTIFTPKPVELLTFLQQFYNGGTDFERPLTEAVKMIETAPDADVVFITDGIAAVSQEFLKQFHADRKRLSFKVLGVQIGAESLDGMKPFCNKVFRLVAEQGTEGLESLIVEIN